MPEPPRTPVPLEIKLRTRSRKLELSFDDGRRFELPFEYLRVHSPSAEVRGHGHGQGMLVMGKESVGIKAVEPVGQYAVKLVFDDGHDTGLYSWKYLYELGSEQASKWAEYQARVQAFRAEVAARAAQRGGAPGPSRGGGPGRAGDPEPRDSPEPGGPEPGGSH